MVTYRRSNRRTDLGKVNEKSRLRSAPFFFFFNKDCLKGTFRVFLPHLRSNIGQRHQPRLILAVVLYFWALLKVFQVTS